MDCSYAQGMVAVTGGGSGGDRTEQSQRPPSDPAASLKTNEHHDTC
ncbi:MAG: hypothetical protein IGR92_05990 [Leptolyngbyaceae cyanobacterium T60_A2020_046]|nr:hypothetical protein [Leptolyngbyaceae cyanobacterium T60_A2020_046]